MNNTVTTKRERPLSPHLSVYRPQITSMMSIMHRITGLVLLAGAFVFVLYLLSFAGVESCDCISSLLKTMIGKIAILVWVTAFYYHFFNGMRHLLWDTGRGLSKEAVVKSGLFVIVAVIASLAITALMVFGG